MHLPPSGVHLSAKSPKRSRSSSVVAQRSIAMKTLLMLNPCRLLLITSAEPSFVTVCILKQRMSQNEKSVRYNKANLKNLLLKAGYWDLCNAWLASMYNIKIMAIISCYLYTSTGCLVTAYAITFSFFILFYYLKIWKNKIIQFHFSLPIEMKLRRRYTRINNITIILINQLEITLTFF